jgi:hypothetical protein
MFILPVADSSDKPITAETELEDPTDNAVAVSESDGDAYSQEAHDEIDAGFGTGFTGVSLISPTGRSRFLCRFLFLPSPSSLCTVNTGMSGLGCPKTLYGDYQSTLFSVYERKLRDQTTSKTSESVWIMHTTLQPNPPSNPNRNRKKDMT